jgi:pimeloyl-ACP methyl ester carboxylesterase
VWAPSLTGLGDRADLATPSVDLTMHIDEISALLERNDITDGVLVGASYGAAVITGLAARIPERVRHLVFVDGTCPTPADSASTCCPAPEPGSSPVPGSR